MCGGVCLPDSASAAGTPTNADDKQSHDDSATADFGFTKVDRNEKQHLVGEVRKRELLPMQW